MESDLIKRTAQESIHILPALLREFLPAGRMIGRLCFELCAKAVGGIFRKVVMV
jgi:hypothetical protein